MHSSGHTTATAAPGARAPTSAHASTRAELNSLVEDAVIHLEMDEGNKIKCDLCSDDLWLAADGKDVSAAIACLLNSGVAPLLKLPEDAPLSKSVVVRTGVGEDGFVLLEICIEAIPAFGRFQDVLCEDATAANDLIRRGLSRVENMLSEIGGKVDGESAFGNPARGMTIRVQLPGYCAPGTPEDHANGDTPLHK